MADPFRQGQRLSNISASELNHIQSDARNRLGYGSQAGAAGKLPLPRSANVVVQGINDAGTALRAGHIIEIKGLANGYNPSWMVNPVYQFGRPSIGDDIVNFSAGGDDDDPAGEEPEWPRHIGVIVDEQPVAEGGIAHAAIAGAAFARVFINDEDDKFANPIDNEFDSLQSVAEGLFRILGKQSDGAVHSVVNCAVTWASPPPAVQDDPGGGGDEPTDPTDPDEPTAALSSMSFARVVSIAAGSGGDSGRATVQPIYIDMDGSVTDVGEPIQAFIFTTF